MNGWSNDLVLVDNIAAVFCIIVTALVLIIILCSS